MTHYPPVSRLADDQPRIDGSIHDEHQCYECGASSRDQTLDSIIRWNPGSNTVEHRFACRDLGPCAMRKTAMGLTELPGAGQ